MGKYSSRPLDLVKKVRLIKNSGLPENPPAPKTEEKADLMLPLKDRVEKFLGILRDKPVKATTMNYLLFYDIEDNKVRRLVAKYLEQKGCVRIQKSVFFANSDQNRFREILEALKEINDCYDNSDSIILVPVNVSDVRAMQLIGKNIDLSVISDSPGTLFF